MELSKRQARLAVLAVFGAMAVLLLARLSAYGIFDPWELTPADQARSLATGQPTDIEGPPLARWLVATGFSLFGVHEWSGRLPIALCGVLTLAAVFFLVARFAGRRAGVYAVVAAGTTPLFVLNAREMLGQSPSFLVETLVGLCAAAAVFRPTTAEGASRRRRAGATLGWLAGAAVAAGLAVLARGALLGVLPALGAVAVTAALSGALTHPDRRRSAAAWAVVGAAVFVAVCVLLAVRADAAQYSFWLGGLPEGGNPPTFEVGVAHVFHALAPWSALAVVGLAFALATSRGGEERRPGENAFKQLVVVWAGLAYAALSLFLSRYGPATWIAVAPLAAAVALLLVDVEESRGGWWSLAVVALLFVGLLVRDFGLYPASAIEGLPIRGAEVPEEFNPLPAWAALFGLFAVAVTLSFGSRPGTEGPGLAGPYRLLAEQWRKGWRYRPWLLGMGLVAALLLVLGLLAAVAPRALPVTTIALKVSKAAAAGIVAIPVLVAAAQLAVWATGKLGRMRGAPVLVAGLLVGAYVSQGFLPALSAHYSPRGVYDAYKRLAHDGEPLGEYRVGSRAAAYYVQGELHDLHNAAEAVRFLAEGDGRRWAVLPAGELPAIDRRFRDETGRHLYVADSTSARVVLVASRAVKGRANESYLSKHVLDHPPHIQHPTHAVFQEEIALLGYDLGLPHDGYVGAGESFTITWYWKDLKPVTGGWQVFVHIDGYGQRIIGDHDPVNGKYPVRLWSPGDIVVDEQTLTVPAHYGPGDYEIFVGFWIGENRLKVVEGPNDGQNRVRVGVLRVR